MAASRRALRRRGAQRGSTLLEGLVAAACLTIALLGGLQAIIFASQQNASAGRMVRAQAITSQTRQMLQSMGRARLLTDVLKTENCADVSTAGSPLAKLSAAAQLTSIDAAPCLIDLDTSAFESFSPTYVPANKESFKRALHFRNEGNAALVGIYVSWNEGGATRFHREFFALYDPAANSAVEGL